MVPGRTTKRSIILSVLKHLFETPLGIAKKKKKKKGGGGGGGGLAAQCGSTASWQTSGILASRGHLSVFIRFFLLLNVL